jgi:hypothetical protein
MFTDFGRTQMTWLTADFPTPFYEFCLFGPFGENAVLVASLGSCPLRLNGEAKRSVASGKCFGASKALGARLKAAT